MTLTWPTDSQCSNAYSTADVINTYVYRKGLIDAQFSYSTAVGMFNCIVSFALVMITNKISQKVNGSGLW